MLRTGGKKEKIFGQYILISPEDPLYSKTDGDYFPPLSEKYKIEPVITECRSNVKPLSKDFSPPRPPEASGNVGPKLFCINAACDEMRLYLGMMDKERTGRGEEKIKIRVRVPVPGQEDNFKHAIAYRPVKNESRKA